MPFSSTQLVLVGIVLLLLAAYGWAMKRWGRSVERAKYLKMVLDTEREVKGAVDRARQTPVRVDADWLKGSRAETPPTKPPDRG